MATSPVSGKSGKVLIGSNSIGEVTKWSATFEASSSRYASSATGGYKASLSGVKSGSGSIDFKLDTLAASAVLEGASATLLLYVDATHFYTVPATIKNFKVEVNIDSGEVVGAAADFDTNGAWTEPTWG